MKKVDKDYQPEEGYPSWDDGDYKVIGFEFQSGCVDEKTKKPILVADKQGNMICRINFTLEDGESGPPHSFALAEIGLIVLGFGGDPKDLPPLPAENESGKISAYLLKGKELAEATGKGGTVSVKNDWVQSIVGGEIVGGPFYCVMIDITPHDGDGLPYPQDAVDKKGNAYQRFYPHFRILAGEGKQPCEFDGMTFSEFMRYHVDVIETEEGPMPQWRLTPIKKQMTVDAVKMAHLMEYTTEGLTTDAGEEVAHADPYNLLPEWLENALVVRKVIRCDRRNVDGWLGFTWETLQPVDNFELDTPTPKKTAKQVETKTATKTGKGPEPDLEEVDRKARVLLVEYLGTLTGDGDAAVEIDGKYTFTDAGKKVAGKYLGPLKKAKVVKDGYVNYYTWDDVNAILQNIEGVDSDGLTEYRNKLAKIGVRVDEPSEEEEAF